eukprot:evm.model.scf_166.1 EVM.evm.TU.scf_166.1   scf_166:1304-1788(+)
MAKGSMSQTSTTAGNRGAGARGGSNAPPAAALRRRTARATSSSGGGTGGGMSRVSQGVMNFYTDDSPGLKIPPVSTRPAGGGGGKSRSRA